jgi:hypothetical protein
MHQRLEDRAGRTRAQALAVDDAHAVQAFGQRVVEKRQQTPARGLDRETMQIECGFDTDTTALQCPELGLAQRGRSRVAGEGQDPCGSQR